MTAFAQKISGSHAVVLQPSDPIPLQSKGALIIPSDPVVTPEMKMLKFLDKAREAVEHLPSQRREEMLVRIEEWTLLFSGAPTDPTVQEECIQTAYRMCYVHWNLEQAMIAYTQNDEARHILEALSVEVKEQLSEILPEGLNANTFRAAAELKFLAHKTRLVAENLLPEKREKVIQMVNDWEFEFFQASPMGPVTEDDRIDAASRICHLQRNLEIVMLQLTQSEQEQLAWDALVVELSRRLSDVLPENLSAEDFRAFYEEGLVEQGMLCILPLIKELRERLYANVNQLSGVLAARFETVKAEMQETHEESQLSQKRIHSKVQAMAVELTELYQDFGKRMEECKALKQQLQAIDTTTDKNINNLHHILRK